MTQSKLETNIEILTVLAQKGPLKLASLMHAVKVNDKALKGYLSFLIRQGLVEEQTVAANSVFFSVTQQGIKILKFFKIIKEEVLTV
jgi:predicted transcriptional regulator